MTTAQPGWYPDPQGFGTLRWFDGEQWTEHRAPAPATEQPAQPSFTPPASVTPGTTFTPQTSFTPQPSAYEQTPSSAQASSYGQASSYPQTSSYGQTSYAQTGGAAGWGAPPTPTRSGGTKALIIVGVVVGSVILVSILAAIAIPVFLNQREMAYRAELEALTCDQANADAVRVSQEGVPDGMVALTSISGSTMTVDNRATAEPSSSGTDALVLTCAGVGLWEDGVTTPLQVHVWLLEDRTLEVGATWED